MTDETAPAPMHHKYIVRLMNGDMLEIFSLAEFPLFWGMVKRDGYMPWPQGVVFLHAIASIVYAGVAPADPQPTATVVKLVPRDEQLPPDHAS